MRTRIPRGSTDHTDELHELCTSRHEGPNLVPCLLLTGDFGREPGWDPHVLWWIAKNRRKDVFLRVYLNANERRVLKLPRLSQSECLKKIGEKMLFSVACPLFKNSSEQEMFLLKLVICLP